MKIRAMIIITITLLFFGCRNYDNELLLSCIKDGSFDLLYRRTIAVSSVTFDDWAYPGLERMKTAFPDSALLQNLSFEADIYHGAKIIIYDQSTGLTNYDSTDSKNTYTPPSKYKFIVFFPRTDHNMANLFKKYFVSKKYFNIKGKFIGV